MPETPEHETLVCEGWWHPNVKSGQVHLHPESPGGGWSVATHRLCEPVYTKRSPRPADNPDSVKLWRISPEANGSFSVYSGDLLVSEWGTRAEAEEAISLYAKSTTSPVKTWSYSQVNQGGADVTHGLTFKGTDAEWTEHLADLTYQGIEPYNAKITGPVSALGSEPSPETSEPTGH